MIAQRDIADVEHVKDDCLRADGIMAETAAAAPEVPMPDRYEPILPPEALDPNYGLTDADYNPGDTPKERSASLQRMFDEWREKDALRDPAELEAEWEDLKRALDSHRPPGHKLFPENEPSAEEIGAVDAAFDLAHRLLAAAADAFPEIDPHNRDRSMLRLLNQWQARDPADDKQTMAELRAVLNARGDSPAPRSAVGQQ